jgi:transmembrane sensor
MNTFEKEKLERYFKEETGKEDAGFVQDLFTDENRKSDLQSFLTHQWSSFIDNSDIPVKDLSPVLHKIHFRINMAQSLKEKRPLQKLRKFYYRAAAVLLLPLLIAGAIGLYRHEAAKNYNQVAWAEIHSTMGSRVSFNLPDGTKGWINSGSTLKYALNFEESRRVELEGEAYFDVTPDKSRPFYVRTSEVQIRVLGTTFNLKAYPDDKTVETTLLTGMLEIQTLSEADGDQQTVVLKPNQKATFQKSTDFLSIGEKQVPPVKMEGVKTVKVSRDVDTVPIVAWKNHKLVFVNEPFESLLVKMERWYDVEITLLDTPRDNLNYTGIFEKETVEQALRALKVATPDFSYSLNKNKINVSFKKKTGV